MYLCGKKVTYVRQVTENLHELSFMEQLIQDQDVFWQPYCPVCKKIRLEKFPFPAEQYLI